MAIRGNNGGKLQDMEDFEKKSWKMGSKMVAFDYGLTDANEAYNS